MSDRDGNAASGCLAVVAACPAAAWCVRRPRRRWKAGRAIALQNQILELRRQVQALQDQVGRGGSPTLSRRRRIRRHRRRRAATIFVAQLLSRVSALEDQVRQLRGRVDETQNQVQRQGADLGKRIDDLAFQVQNPQAVRHRRRCSGAVASSRRSRHR